MKKYTFIFTVLFLSLTFCTYGQKSTSSFIKSQTKKSENYLVDKFYEYINDSIKAYPYAKAYLQKAKKAKDSLKIAGGFYFLSVISEGKTRMNLIDSTIVYTQNKQNKFFPAMAYISAGNYYYKDRDFYNSLKNYLKAKKSVDDNENPRLRHIIKNRIGLLKSRYGEDKEALQLFKEVYKYYVEQHYNEKNKGYYFPIIFALADSYYRNERLDSASFYTKKGYRESENNPKFQNYFIFEQGIIEYGKEHFSASIDSLTKSLPGIIHAKDLPNVAYAHYFIGKSYLKKKHPEKAIAHFKKVDSVFQLTKDIHPDLRDTYVRLIEYYKSKKEKDSQLLYINQLLKVDSTLHSNYRIINKKFTDEYDTPKLMAEKNKIIGQLKGNIVNFTSWINLLLLFILIAVVLVVWLHHKRKRDLEQFKKLLAVSSETHEEIELEIEEITKSNSELPPDLSKTLLEYLNRFERENGFLKKKLKIYDLAKQFGTNSKYLSMAINEYKHKNFSQYLNDLRISYVITRLREDKKFRKYTIKAIAEEIGFSNSESFSKAFHKITKIYPSFFIKQLEKSEKETS